MKLQCQGYPHDPLPMFVPSTWKVLPSPLYSEDFPQLQFPAGGFSGKLVMVKLWGSSPRQAPLKVLAVHVPNDFFFFRLQVTLSYFSRCPI